MRHGHIGLMLVLLAINAAAAAAQPARLSDRALEMEQGRIRLNSKGGYYSEVEVKAQKSQEFVMMLDHRNLHEKWAPSAWVCLVRDPDGRRVCADLLWPDRKVKRLVVDQIDRTGKDDERRVRMGNGYFPDQEVRLTLRISGGEAQFQVGDDVVTRPLDFKPERVTLGCSSAECIFTLL